MSKKSYLYSARPIEGNILFDGNMAQIGYPLNKMCHSLNEASAREEFSADEAAYCDKFNLSEAQKQAILQRDVLGLLKLGGSVYYLAKFVGLLGMNMQDIGAIQTGMSVEEFHQKLRSAGE